MMNYNLRIFLLVSLIGFSESRIIGINQKPPTKEDLLCRQKFDYHPTTIFKFDPRFRKATNIFNSIASKKLQTNKKITNYLVNGEEFEGDIYLLKSDLESTVEYFNNHFPTDLIKVEATFPVVINNTRTVCVLYAICALVNAKGNEILLKITNLQCCLDDLGNYYVHDFNSLNVIPFVVDLNSTQSHSRVTDGLIGIVKYLKNQLKKYEDKFCENYVEIVLYSTIDENTNNRKHLWWIGVIPVVLFISMLLIKCIINTLKNNNLIVPASHFIQ